MTRQSKLEITQQSLRLSFRPSVAESHKKEATWAEPVLPKIEDADEESANSPLKEARQPENQMFPDHGLMEESSSGAGVRDSGPGWVHPDEGEFFTRKTTHNDELMREISFNTLTQNTQHQLYRDATSEESSDESNEAVDGKVQPPEPL